MSETPMPSAEWFAREEERLKLVCIEQAGQMLAERPELRAVFSQGELAGTIFLALCADLGQLPVPGMAHD
jgi:hypothetical protein